MIKDTWTVDGKILVKDRQVQIHVVNTMAALLQFCAAFSTPGSLDFLYDIDRRSKQRSTDRVYSKGPRLRTYAEATAAASDNSQDPSADS